jgi:hypothetical protein
MVSKEGRRGEGSLCLMGHGIKEPIRWSTISLGIYHYPHIGKGIGRHATLIMANPLTIGRVFKIKCAPVTQIEKFAQSDQLYWEFTLERFKKLKVVKHVQSKSFNFSFW